MLTLLLCVDESTHDDTPKPHRQSPTQTHGSPRRSQLPAAVAALVEEHSLRPFQVQVPAHAPASREEFAAVNNAVWPVTFHPPHAHLPHPPSEVRIVYSPPIATGAYVLVSPPRSPRTPCPALRALSGLDS